MPANPEVIQQEGVTIIAFGSEFETISEDRIDAASAALMQVAAAEPPRVIVDLSRTKFFGSSFIEVLFRVWNRLKNRNGRFALCGLSPYCSDVLEVTNLHHLWQIYKTRQEALAAFKADNQG